MRDRLGGVKTLHVAGILDDFEKEAVIASLDIISLFSSFNVALTKKGKSYMGLCPWHKDTTPSLSVDPEKKLYHCFGCGESGDAITLVEKMKGLNFKESLLYLREHSTLKRNNDWVVKRKDEEAPRIERDAGQVSTGSDTGIRADMPVIAEYYRKKLMSAEEARAYLKKRGLDDAVLCERFFIGYAENKLKEVAGKEQLKALQHIGIINDKGNEHFNGCIVFPLSDADDRIVGMYGRAIDTSTPLGNRDSREVKHLYLKGPHKGIFNRKASKVYKEIILTESIIDALSLIHLGIARVQSLYGTNGLTDEHVRILKSDRVKNIILALDNDEAGRKASATLKEKLLGEGFAVGELFPPEDVQGKRIKDWNEYLTHGGDAAAVKDSLSQLSFSKGAASLAVSMSESLILSTGASDDNSSTHTESPHDYIRITKEQMTYICVTNELTYRVSGVKEMFVGSLRVAIKAERRLVGEPDRADKVYVDTVDLYSARGRASFSMNLSKASMVESSRIEKDLLALLEHFEMLRDKALYAGTASARDELTEEEKTLGLSLLKDPNIFERIVSDMELLGYVGEDVNKKLLYLAASSRILDDPISVIILSQSSAGKSYLVDTVKKLIPEEDVVSVTSLSDQALNYAPDLMHKFLILGEAVHSDVVEHQIREMLSGKELSRLVAVKDEKTGVMKSAAVKKPVVVSAVMSGTNNSINPENASRCFVIAADESREQTRRIHLSQRNKYSLERYAAKENDMPHILRTHHAAQRLLQKVRVVNPFAHNLNFPDMLMRTRRDHDRFMDLIACVCFLRQHQKERKYDRSIEYIECDLADYAVAYEIMIKGVLSTTMRELSSGSIMLYEEIRRMANETANKRGVASTEVHFIQRDVRDATGLGGEFIKKHLRHLTEYEYIQVVSGKTRGTRLSYKLRIDEPAESVDMSMIPSPEIMASFTTKLKSGYSGYE